MDTEAMKHDEQLPIIIVRLRRALLIVLALCVIVPILTMNHEPEIMSEADNRKLAKAPTFEDGLTGFRDGLTAYMSDRIGFRDQMIAAYSLLNDRAFHLMTHPLYEYGEDGQVFFRFHEGAFDERFVEKFASYIKDMQDYCAARDIPFLYVISPDKRRVYQEYIPNTVGELPSSTAMLEKYLQAYGINYIDLGEAVIAAKDEGVEVFNRVYDAGHWNTEGMYAGSQMIVDRLQEMGLDVDDINLNDYEPVYTQQNVLPVSNYPINEVTYKYQLKDGIVGGIEVEDFRQNLLIDERHSAFGYYENEARSSNSSLLMFQGSYFNTQGTMLQNQFSRIAQVHDYENVFNLPYYVDIFQPDAVVFENADYTVTSSYYSEDSLQGVTLPPAYDEYILLPVASEEQAGWLFYDSAMKVANFSLSLSSAAPIEAYVLVGDVFYDTTIDEDGVLHWGAATENLERVDEVTVVVIRDEQQYHYRYQLAR